MANTCASSLKNTASSRCKFDWGLFKRVIVTPASARYSGVDEEGDPLTFEDWLEKNVHAATPSERFFPMPAFTDNEDNSTDRQTWENAYGQQYTLRPGNIAFTQAYQPDYCLSNRLDSFNDGIEKRIIILDAHGKAWGCKDSKGNFMGFAADIFHMAPRPTPADSISEGHITYTTKKPSEFANKFPYDYELDVDNFDGLTDVNMVMVKSDSNLVFTFTDDCGDNNLTGEFGSLMDKNCWLKNGTAFTTAPTYNAAAKNFTIAASGFNAGEKITIADPSVLFARGITKKECKTVAEVTA